MERDGYLFAINVLSKIQDQFEDEKYRKLKLGIPVVEDAKKILLEAGFLVSKDESWLVFVGQDREAVEAKIKGLQARADALLDPETITFAQVAEIMKREGTLPGIRTDIDDSVIGERLVIQETDRPRKPWEI
jgi:hypothetical protein